MSDQPEEETMTTDPAAMLDTAAARLREDARPGLSWYEISPPVALALADWLDWIRNDDAFGFEPHPRDSCYGHALAVARAIASETEAS